MSGHLPRISLHYVGSFLPISLSEHLLSIRSPASLPLSSPPSFCLIFSLISPPLQMGLLPQKSQLVSASRGHVGHSVPLSRRLFVRFRPPPPPSLAHSSAVCVCVHQCACISASARLSVSLRVLPPVFILFFNFVIDVPPTPASVFISLCHACSTLWRGLY